ncbi:right-handed parallel beta-helix repeat-containing protein [Phocaeicola faecicola]|jgi:DNA-directed RNA polymerase subunit H (RpoH/RPB5)|uniref:right-handed parallel beta-helix repeat-containing protein n=1 Tax=Phocaeicola faecicola TaxID=2739389 RepID=UPI0015B49386|nr:right-handed parallel beta-helix repeat-containing protein [Phocaeicola faecicola]MCI5744383.1 right-handed parallel beta-helix repeat-containing protein [Bacteroides sp.]MDD6909345.1 right-handed parallel beta-helix repeat-containing protein [Bacteroidaceae bacterium]MDY4872540.1 right-handed parallel beta-helix repeat-containing protein [Phocaeicola faecicola]
MKLKNVLLAGTALFSLSLTTACSNEDFSNGPEQGGQGSENDDVIIWPADTVVELKDHYVVPEGTSLIIKEGAQIIATQKVGVNELPIEFTVKGNLYCEGTAEKPILFSLPEAERTKENIFAGKWGGIVATSTCQEMLIDHTIIEYAGGETIEGAPAVNAGIYEAGEDMYPQITTTNPQGRYVICNSVLRYGKSDAIYMMGGNGIIMNNTFVGNGETGEEAVNVKSGCMVDVAGNIMFSPNTNGLKLSSSDQSEVRAQARIQAYNNTIINAGWRRDSDKGGCVYVQENAAVHVFNNLMVNCKFRAMTPDLDQPASPEDGRYDDVNSVIDYNYYASGSQKVDPNYVYKRGIEYSWEGYNYEEDGKPFDEYDVEKVDKHSVIATEEDSKDPLFVNFPINEVSLTEYVYNDAWDFHVQAGSAVLNGAYSGNDAKMAPLFGTEGLTVNQKVYTSPRVEARFGAYGTK